MPTERPCRSLLDSSKRWVVCETGKSQFAYQQRSSSNKPQGPGGSSQLKAYRDTAYWGKDKMTYEELTSAWDAFNRSEELKAFYFTQSEAVDRVLAQVFQNVGVDCEDLDGFRPSCETSRSSSSSSRHGADCCQRTGCGCKDNHLLGVQHTSPAFTSAGTYDKPNIDQLTIPPSSPRNSADACTSINSFDTTPRNTKGFSQRRYSYPSH